MIQVVNQFRYPALFADGGVVTLNPSPLAGTWPACLVEDLADPFAEEEYHNYQRTQERSGLILPAEWGIKTISNNFSEAYALLMALRIVRDGYPVYVYSDSLITLGRFFQGWAWKNTPFELQRQCLAEVKRVKPKGYMLLDGHPTKKQLKAGFGKRNNPCSEHNVWCDTACGEHARGFVQSQGGIVALGK